MLDAHPAIGATRLSSRSAAEQGADAEPEVMAELERLNREYEDRHGFRFVVFVNRRPKAEILEVLRSRIDRPTRRRARDGARRAGRDRPGPLAARMILGLDAYLTDWLNLLFRWLHVIAGIAWIGTSFYFVFLDNALERPREAQATREKGVGRRAVGGPRRRLLPRPEAPVSPARLPEPLHWFKWEAYTTWLSGFALLVVLYYLNAEIYLIDPSVADLVRGGRGRREPCGAGARLGRLRRSLPARRATSSCWERQSWALTALAAWGAGELFSGRGAFIQVGAMLGHDHGRERLVRDHPGALGARPGQAAAPRAAIRSAACAAKQRSVHNNYLTLPVRPDDDREPLPVPLRAPARAGSCCVALMLIGAWVRHYFNLRHAGANGLVDPGRRRRRPRSRWRCAMRARRARRRVDDRAGRLRAQVQAIVEQRCATCHSADPTSEQFHDRSGRRRARHAGADRRSSRGDQRAGRRLARDAARQRDRA